MVLFFFDFFLIWSALALAWIQIRIRIQNQEPNKDRIHNTGFKTSSPVYSLLFREDTEPVSGSSSTIPGQTSQPGALAHTTDPAVYLDHRSERGESIIMRSCGSNFHESSDLAVWAPRQSKNHKVRFNQIIQDDISSEQIWNDSNWCSLLEAFVFGKK